MEREELRKAIYDRVPVSVIADLQLSIDEMKGQGQFKQYVA